MDRYTTIVQWSEEDRLFSIAVPDFADRVVMPCASGKTREKAVCSGEEVIAMYLESWQIEDIVPEPRMMQIA